MREVASYSRYFLASGLICLVLMFALPGYAATTFEASPKTLTVGVVPQFDIPRIQAIWRPILDEMEKRSGNKFVLSGAATIPEFERDLIQGEYDLAYINPYQVVKVGERQGYQPLVRDVSQNLHGIVVVPSNSPIQSVEQLKNRVVAFPAPNALGATLLVRAGLYDRYGFEVVPRYVLSHSSVYLNVALEEVIAGGGVQKTLSQQPEELQDRLRVLYKTDSVPSHPVVVHRRVPVQIRQQLLSVMLALGQDAVGRDLLSAVPIVEIGVAKVKDYQPLTEMGLERFQ